MKLLVFDVGGTEIKYSVIDDKLNMEDSSYFPTPKTPYEERENTELVEKDYIRFLDSLVEVYQRFESRVDGIAMSLPGFIDIKNGRQCGGGAIQGIINRNVAKDLALRCGCPVKIANDAKCAAIAEKVYGNLKDCRNAGVFIIGTGVGGGLIINGEVLNGEHFTAGELSFIRMNLNGPWDDRKNTMGDICSTTGLLDLYRMKKNLPEQTELDGRLFFEKYHENEPEAVESLKVFCNHVAQAILNLSFILDLETMAIGGGISRQPALIEGIRNELDILWKKTGLVEDSGMKQVKIVTCKYLNEANQIGAFCYYMKDA
ncbi:MAG: ROK family protein [Lachnospiraceae bacterium]|nr:ROK family protein [Lachnospiraceae bacterium]